MNVVAPYFCSSIDSLQCQGGGTKRLREYDEDVQDCKRRRSELQPIFDEQGEEAEGLLHRCITWLMSLHPQNRPKSLTSLRNGLKDICSLTYSVDPQVVFHHLLLNGLLCLDGNRVYFSNKNSQGSFQIFVPTEQLGLSTRVSTDFSNALSKAASWVRSNRGFSDGRSVLLDSFLHSLAQICLVRRSLQPERVVEHFQIRGLISFLPTGTLEYNLPVELKPGHYMAYADSTY